MFEGWAATLGHVLTKRAIKIGGVPIEIAERVHATDEKVRIFDVILDLGEQGWDIVPNRRGKPFMPHQHPRAGQAIMAEYRRMCGATRRFAIAWPPPRVLRIPFSKQPMMVTKESFCEDTYSILKFELDSVRAESDQFGNGPLVAFYREMA